MQTKRHSRSAISRAYYCAYHQALNHLTEHHNFQISEDRLAHDQVWREFSSNQPVERQPDWAATFSQ